MDINVEERVNTAKKLFREGYNCTQSVVLAYRDITGMDEKLLATITAPLGGGMGRLREVCGTISGMSVIAGFLKPFFDPHDKDAKRETYTLVQEFAETFRNMNGSIVCRELMHIPVMKESPVPEERTEQYYSRRPCIELVGCAARIVGEYLKNKEDIFAEER